MILLSHAAPTAAVRRVALALNRAGVLGEFWTCLDERSSPVLVRLPAVVLEEEASRPVGSPAADLRERPLTSIPSLEASGGGNGSSPAGSNGCDLDAAAHSLDRQMSARIETHRFKGVYAYENGAEETFRAGGRQGLLRIYDLSAGHWRACRAILEEEALREPEWAATLHPNRDAPHAIARKDAELEQADLVVACSSFVLRTLEQAEGVHGAIAVLPPGGSVLAAELPAIAPVPGVPGKLRVLFAGELGQRTGLSYLFRACRELRDAATLTVIGMPPPAGCVALERELKRVRWLPLSSAARIREEMAAHDVFVLPSLFDGFNEVLLDAMAMGLPILATRHTAAPDVIEDGVQGFLIPIRSSDAIVEKLELLRCEPDRRAEMSASARRCVRRFTWENYERRLAATVATALAQR